MTTVEFLLNEWMSGSLKPTQIPLSSEKYEKSKNVKKKITEFHQIGDEVQVFEGKTGGATTTTVVAICVLFQHKLDDIAWKMQEYGKNEGGKSESNRCPR